MSTRKVLKEAKKLVAKHNKETKKNNSAFEKLKPAEKRVYIARDVIAQLRLGKINAETGWWVKYSPKRDDVKKDKQLKEVFNKMETCTACALGGMFVCAVRAANALKFSQLDSRQTGVCMANNYDEVHEYGDDGEIYFNDIQKYLGKFFSKDQLDLIEIAFEGGSGGIESEYDNSYHQDAEAFFTDHAGVSFSNYDREFNDDDKMRLIMENIIVNKGTFMPAQRPCLKPATYGFKG